MGPLARYRLCVEKLRKGWKMLSNDVISIPLKGKNSISLFFSFFFFFFRKCKVMVCKYGSLIKFAVHKVFGEHYANKILIIAHSKCHQSACRKGNRMPSPALCDFSYPHFLP